MESATAAPEMSGGREQALALFSRVLLERYKNLGRRAGLQYGNERSIFTVAGYVPAGEEDFEHYWALYQRDAIAGKIVDLPAQTTWKIAPTLIDDGTEDQESSELVEKFEALAERLDLWHYFERADRLCRVGRYSVMLLGTAGTTDQELKTPLEGPLLPEDLLYVSVFHEEEAEIARWEQDVGNERFGRPTIYRIDLSSGVQGFPQATVEVHHTRVLHVAEDLLTDEVFGRPALKRCLNRLFDLEKICASTGEAYWQLAARILHAKIDPEFEFDADTLDDLGEALEEIVHDLRRHFLGQGAELDWLESTPPDPSSAGNFFMTLIAAAADIPVRILFGSERGELASSQDERNFMGRINQRQETHAEPTLLRAFVDRLTELGALPLVEAGYSVSWPSLFEETAKERAETNKAKADTAKALTPMGGDPLELVTIDAEGDLQLREVVHEEEVLPEGPPALPPPGGEAEELEEEEEALEEEEAFLPGRL